jgi:hypothetical protein
MATYKVSYKMLAKQGEELKAVAKLVDGYTDRVNQIRGKLGDNETLAAVRNNLSKFGNQLTESRTILSVAGGLLTSTVEKYTAVETRQVKNVDSYKAHNRDFYKNPVVVASAGGAGAGVTAATMQSAPVSSASAQTMSSSAIQTATPVQTATSVQTASEPAPATVNYTENNTVNNYTQVNIINESSAMASPIETASVASMSDTSAMAGAASSNMAYTPAPAAMPSAEAVVPIAGAVAAGGASAGAVAGVAVGAGLAGASLGAGAVLAVKHLIKNKDTADDAIDTAETSKDEAEYDPEKELAEALERVRLLSEEE